MLVCVGARQMPFWTIPSRLMAGSFGLFPSQLWAPKCTGDSNAVQQWPPSLASGPMPSPPHAPPHSQREEWLWEEADELEAEAAELRLKLSAMGAELLAGLHLHMGWGVPEGQRQRAGAAVVGLQDLHLHWHGLEHGSGSRTIAQSSFGGVTDGGWGGLLTAVGG